MARAGYLAVLLSFVSIAIYSLPQVTVTSSGYATLTGPAYPAIPASPPILFAPSIHLVQPPTTPSFQATGVSGAVAVPAAVPIAAAIPLPGTFGLPLEMTAPEMGMTINPAAQSGSNADSNAQTAYLGFNFGAAQFETHLGAGGVGQSINGKSLGEIAREIGHRPAGLNARVYTNADIEQLNQTGATVNRPSARSNPRRDAWSPDNGVIKTQPSQPPENSVAQPEQENRPSNRPPTGIRTPFIPKPQSYGPSEDEVTPSQPQPRGQVTVRPLVRREPDELVQNARNLPLAQRNEEHAADQSRPQGSELPRTASKLPLLGVAGLFSVTMGLFVRYQRAKTR